jgi:hypothetical protein
MTTPSDLRYFVAAAALVATSAVVQAQDPSAPLIGTPGVIDDGVPRSSPSSTASQDNAPPAEHTGLATLVTDIVADFKMFPRRESTWVILGSGGAAALAVHPADTSLNRHLVSSGWADKLWKPGHIIGGPALYGVPVALYVGGRYLCTSNGRTEDEHMVPSWARPPAR